VGAVGGVGLLWVWGWRGSAAREGEEAARAAAVSESDQWPSRLCRSKQDPQRESWQSGQSKRWRWQKFWVQEEQGRSAGWAHTGQGVAGSGVEEGRVVGWDGEKGPGKAVRGGFEAGSGGSQRNRSIGGEKGIL
jgi:hypothetical protein